MIKFNRSGVFQLNGEVYVGNPQLRIIPEGAGRPDCVLFQFIINITRKALVSGYEPLVLGESQSGLLSLVKRPLKVRLRLRRPPPCCPSSPLPVVPLVTFVATC